MSLPPNVIKLINAYSKPVTNPYWRYGTSSALLIKNSHVMRSLARELVYMIQTQHDRVYFNFGKDILSTTIETPFNEIIQTYGEEIFQLYKEQYVNDRHEHILSNFYSFSRWYLIKTGHFKAIQYVTYYPQFNFNYEWLYLK
jgi:hypothetical protein